jgi:peroxiredoxin Q/BCP
MAVTIGEAVPCVSMLTDENINLSLADFKGKKLILYFYPKDDTPGCTLESCGFRDFYDLIKSLGADVVGVSKDSVASHIKFKAKHRLPFPLISDGEGALCALFDVWKEKSMYGKTYMGIDRSTFVLDAEGILRHEWRGVKVPGHLDEVMKTLKTMP